MEKKVSKSQQIRDFIAANPKASVKDVAQALGVKVQYVYDTKSRMHLKPKKRGRPVKKITAVTVLPAVDRSAFVDGLKQRIRHLEVELELQAMIVGALKNRLYAAAV
jgi:hypothetical protein